jgi:hypothetical protein
LQELSGTKLFDGTRVREERRRLYCAEKNQECFAKYSRVDIIEVQKDLQKIVFVRNNGITKERTKNKEDGKENCFLPCYIATCRPADLDLVYVCKKIAE